MNLLKELKQVKSDKIVLFDETDKRVIRAMKFMNKRGICQAVLVSNEEVKGLTTIKPTIDEHMLKHLMKKRDLGPKKAKELLQETNWYATTLVSMGRADVFISGAIHPTKRTLLPALKLLANGYASTYFLMLDKKRTWLFADCALNINPDEKQLAKIAYDTANSAIALGIAPKIAMLSFSTNGSATHEMVDKVSKATRLARSRLKGKGVIIEGEVQFDAAIDAKVSRTKNPNSKLQGDANVFIFPDINSGNIGSKIAARLGHMKALGPMMQGLRKPVNDLSRGCTTEEIVLTTALTIK